MKTRLYSHDFEELLLEHGYGMYDNASNITEITHKGDYFFGKAEYKEMFFDGIHIGYGSVEVAKNTLIQVDSSIETVEMHFTLSGNSKTNTKDKTIEFGTNQHNIIYSNQFKGEMIWGNKTPLRMFEVNLLPSFFSNYLSKEEGGMFKNFRTQILQKSTGVLRNKNLKITPRMHLIINEIINCTRKDVFKRIFIQSKVLELLLLQLEQMNNDQDATIYSINKKDVEKMYFAKEIILNNLSTPYSLITLAHQIGTNEFTLKKGFKEVFGTTVFELINNERMEIAKKKLIEDNLSINELSEFTGYKSPQHFSAAFKRKFGFPPSKIKNNF